MDYSVEALAGLVGGEVVGDGAVRITGARPILDARAGDITFVEDDRYARQLKQSLAAAAVVRPGFQANGLPLIRVDRPLDAFVMIFQRLQRPARPMPLGVHPSASIASTARLGSEHSVSPFVAVGDEVVIGDRCRLMPGVSIGDGCRLGSDVTLHPHVVLYPGTVVGDRVVIHAGAVIGADGFGYRPQGEGHVKTPQLGHVEIEDDVEIGANTTIDRGTFHVTRIGAGTKIDNLVQVAHNCQIGRHNLIVSQVGIAGSTRTGDRVVIAGQAGIRDHITIGPGAVVGGMAGVMRDVAPGERVLGIPATSEREQKRLVASIHRLPELREKLIQLSRQVEEMSEQRKSA